MIQREFMRWPNIVVTGGRDYYNRVMVWNALGQMKPARVAHGGATGADTLARQWAQFYRKECVTYPANWALHGRSAGPIRNEEMLMAERPCQLLAFPGGRGTRNCMQLARELGIQIVMGEELT